MVSNDYEVAVVEGDYAPLKDGAAMAGYGGFRDVEDKAHLTAEHDGGERGTGGGSFAMQRFD